MESQSSAMEFRRHGSLPVIEENPSTNERSVSSVSNEYPQRRKSSVKRNALILKSTDIECTFLADGTRKRRNGCVLSLSNFNVSDNDQRESTGNDENGRNCDYDADDDDNNDISWSSQENENSDLKALKQQTTKLNLKTRRPSFVTWKSECLIKSGPLFKPRLICEGQSNRQSDNLTEDRKNKINDSLLWIRNELSAMRTQDQELAKELLALRQNIQSLKLQWSCEDHKDLLEDMTYDLEERHILQRICDVPLAPPSYQNPLKHFGVTRMNLSARRFSTC